MVKLPRPSAAHAYRDLTAVVTCSGAKAAA